MTLTKVISVRDLLIATAGYAGVLAVIATCILAIVVIAGAGR